MKLACLALSLLALTAASAQTSTNMPMSPGMQMGPGMEMTQQKAQTPAVLASPEARDFMKSMQDGMAKMDHDMAAAPMSGNPDRDFAAMMIPHHEGAIAMARAELKYGTDPAMRGLARSIISAQKKEIREMKDFLRK